MPQREMNSRAGWIQHCIEGEDDSAADELKRWNECLQAGSGKQNERWTKTSCKQRANPYLSSTYTPKTIQLKNSKNDKQKKQHELYVFVQLLFL